MPTSLQERPRWLAAAAAPAQEGGALPALPLPDDHPVRLVSCARFTDPLKCGNTTATNVEAPPLNSQGLTFHSREVP